MTILLLPYVLPLLLTALLMAAFVVMAVPQRSVPGVRWFLVFTGALGLWSLAYAAEFIAPGQGGKLLAAKVQYLGITAVPVAWLAFAAEYAGVSRWARGTVAAVLAVPVATLILAWTNGAHGLVWSTVGLTSGLPYTVLALGHGGWFWVHVSFSYLYLLLATGLLVRVILVRHPLFRRQAALLLLACLPPWLGNVLYVTGLGPAYLDLTVFGFAISGIVGGWAIFRWKLLSIGPIARDTIVEGMSEAMVVVDREGRIVDVNSAARDILGLPPDRVIGWDAREVLSPLGVVQDDTRGRRQTVTAADGERTYDYRVDPLRDPKGRLRGWTIMLHDVTARAAEAAALQKARDIAAGTARAQRAFLTNMNHEIRTPLNGVMGMLQLLLSSDLDDEQRQYAEAAHASAEELLALVASILDFTSVEAGEIELDSVTFDIAPIIEKAVAGPRADAAAKGVDLVVRMEPGVPTRMKGDPARLEKVLDVLVGNAVKFTDEGSVRIRTSNPDGSESVPGVRIEVRDTGIGIPAHRLGAIFDEFVQADGSLTRRHEGVGLGLSIAHRLVAGMGGDLQVTSEDGVGSTFWFVLPVGGARAGA